MQASAEQRLDWLAQIAGLGYAPEGNPFPTGRPDRATVRARTQHGTPVVAKFCPERGAQTFENMQKLWASAFGERRQPPGLPRPLDYLPKPGVLISEYFDGRPLSEAGRLSETHARGAVELLVALHGSDVPPPARRSSRGIVRSARRKAERVAELAPQYADAIASLADALETHRARDTEMVPSHGDFSMRNVLAASGRFVLIDWERLQWADPMRDIVYFGISTWLPRLRRGRLPDRSLLNQVLAHYRTLRPEANLEKQIGFHIAAGLLRIACSLIELWPAEAYLVPGLVAIAHRELMAS
jgi:phosphotransferase family enzyme